MLSGCYSTSGGWESFYPEWKDELRQSRHVLFAWYATLAMLLDQANRSLKTDTDIYITLYHHIFHHSTIDTMHKNTFQVNLDGKQVTPPTPPKMVSSVAKAPCFAPWQKVATSLPLPAYGMASPFCAGHIDTGHLGVGAEIFRVMQDDHVRRFAKMSGRIPKKEPLAATSWADPKWAEWVVSDDLGKFRKLCISCIQYLYLYLYYYL